MFDRIYQRKSVVARHRDGPWVDERARYAQPEGQSEEQADAEEFRRVEEEVIDGMSALLGDPELRAIFVEVHFALLEARGKANAPVAIERKGHTQRP